VGQPIIAAKSGLLCQAAQPARTECSHADGTDTATMAAVSAAACTGRSGLSRPHRPLHIRRPPLPTAHPADLLRPRTLAVLGFALITIGTIGCTQLSVGTTWQSLQGWLVLRGLGLGLAMTPLSTLALAIVSNRELARASSLVSVMRQVAGAIGLSA